MRNAIALILLASLTTACGTRRTIHIDSTPPGALVWLNNREIGRTPVATDFLYYGTYDVRLVAQGHEPLMTTGEAKAPLWDTMPIDLVSELLPGDKQAIVEWHYELVPLDNSRDPLIARADEVRGMIQPPLPAGEGSPDSSGPGENAPDPENASDSAE